MAVALPTLDVEESFLSRGYRSVIAVDEVGRGAIAGPVTVGVTLIDARVATPPAGIRDSKLLSEPRREALAPLAADWVRLWAVGEASAREIDEVGIIAALGIAGARAFARLADSGADVGGAAVLLDGSHDWLSAALGPGIRVTPRVKADRDCVAVAAASVIAKVHRDRGMHVAHAERPHYEWAANKGYGSAAHLAAITVHGPCELHRVSWLRGRAAPV